MDRLRLPFTVRLSAVLAVAAAFLAGAGGGLLGAHATLESDVPLAALADPAAVRAEHGDRVRVHGLVVEHRIDAGSGPGPTAFTYVLLLDDGSARAAFPVPRPDHERIPDGRWIVLPLRWEGEGYAAGPPEGAIQPWAWRGALTVAAVALAGAAASRATEIGLRFTRKGDRIRVEAREK